MTSIVSFDDDYLFNSLSRKGGAPCVLFALLAATRLRGAIDRYLSSAPRTLQAVNAAHRRLWEDIEDGGALEEVAISAAIDGCAALLPDEEQLATIPCAPYVDDALAALMYAYRCRHTGDAREAVWAARRGYDSVDLFAMREMDLLPSDPEGELHVLRHPLVQTELQRQRRDLEELEQLGQPLGRSSIRAFRSRAEKEFAIPFAST